MRRFSVLLLSCLFAGSPGCGSNDPITELVLEIDTNISVPAEMNAFTLSLSSDTRGEFFTKTYSLGTGPTQVMLPRRMTLVPAGSAKTITVLATGLLDQTPVVARTVITAFAPRASKLLRVDLLRTCLGVSCSPGMTCIAGGSCVDAHIDPAALPNFNPNASPKPSLDTDSGVALDSDIAEAAEAVEAAGVDSPPLPGADAPVGDPPISDAPVVDAPVVDAPVLDAPAVDSPVVEASKDVATTLANGTSCTASSECESKLCVDGVCCNSACTDTCLSCKVPGSLGKCAPVPLGDPSTGDCPDDGQSSCGRNGKCNGGGGCMLYPSGTVRTPETCPTGTAKHTRPSLCDGLGGYNASQVLFCTPYMCNSATNSCYETCTSGGSECQSPNLCANGSCGSKTDGQTCSSPGECASNLCEQGACCATPCQDLCKSCAVEGSFGTCSFVKPGKPDSRSRCQDQGAATCGTNGLCDGRGACQKYAPDVACKITCDPTSTTLSRYTCDGQGVCGQATTQTCSPYSCGASGCKNPCRQASDCASGYICSANGTCVLPPPENCMNGIDDDGNRLIDCADPACSAGYMCVPAVPSGWTGPAEVYEGTPETTPTCTGGYPQRLFTGYGAPNCDFTCSPCGCGTPANVTCGNPGLSYTTEPNGLCPKPTPVAADMCLPYKDPIPLAQFSGFSPPIVDGVCAANGGTPSMSNITWNAGLVCSASAKGGAGCAAGSICWPKPQPAFLPQACVFASGDTSCPSAGYTKKHSYFDSQQAKDSRTCEASCSCGTPTGSCAAKLNVWGKASTPCSGIGGVTYTLPMACQSPRLEVGSLKFTVGGFSSGSCVANGTVKPNGGCTPTGSPVTTCCLP